jgi:hypothetical protein
MALTRRQFLRRGALLAAGGLAVPPWAAWLSEQMEKLRPSRRVVVWRAPVKGPWVPIRLPDGRVINVRDWTDQPLYETIDVSPALAAYQDFRYG